MTEKNPLFLILSGDGINCENETAHAFELAGADYKIMHINELLEKPKQLEEVDGLALPGGFSFGDELGSGQIMALKIKHKLGDHFFKMIESKKPIIGICNGFQVLIKLGLLPFPEKEERIAALAPNTSGHFIDRWITLKNNNESTCLWTKDLEQTHINLPIRHGEGRIVLKDEDTYQTLKEKGLIPLTYTEDVNGSHGNIAALTDPSGTILGMMPHPEAFVSSLTNKSPEHTAQIGDGLFIFKNIVRILKGQEHTKKEQKYA